MPDDASLTPGDDSAVTNQISICAYQALISIQQQHPELLTPGYRDIPWREPQYKSSFMAGLSKKISQRASKDELIPKLREYLGLFLVSSFFESPAFGALESEIRLLTQKETDADAIAILLLDTENLQLDAETEKILEKACQYRIQIKIAFAHWTSSSMRGQDAKFHSRNYQLIHVPPGENSADLQMTAYGSSILLHYPNTKEVLVCSSDRGLLHLCNVLHDQGLTVYRVSRKGQIISVFNKKTEQPTTWIIQITVDKFIFQIESLIKNENRRYANQWVMLSKLSQFYQEKYNLSFIEAISNYTKYQSEKEFFTNYPNHFAIHQLPNKPELYVSLFNRPLTIPSPTQKKM